MKKRTMVVLSMLVCTMLFGCQKTQGPFEMDNLVSDRYTETDFAAIEEQIGTDVQNLFDGDRIIEKVTGSLTVIKSKNIGKPLKYGFFFVKFLFLYVVCVVIMI